LLKKTLMTSSQPGSITACFEQLAAGDNEAMRLIWTRYFDRLVAVARKQLGDAPRRAFDEEDVALSVLECLRRGAEDGRFASMRDRTELWKLLVTITKQKTIDRIRRETAQKRGGKAAGEDIQPHDSDRTMSVEEFFVAEPSPAELVEMQEQIFLLLSILRDDSLRRVAVSRLNGYTTTEIAELLKVTTRSVERKLRLIRETWQRELDR